MEACAAGTLATAGEGVVLVVTRPFSRTTSAAQLSSMLERWVIRITARPRISRRIAPRIAASASVSTALVGSSRISTGLSFRKARDRKSTRLNSSHITISYAVFCLKKKNQTLKLKDVTAAAGKHIRLDG